MAEDRTPLFTRIAALIAGVGMLLAAAIPTLGVVLSAPLGIWALHRFRRARGRSLSIWDSWIGAVSGATVALLIISGVVVTTTPSGSWNRIRQAVDSVSVEGAKQPPPEWLSRFVPTADRHAKSGTATPAAFNTFMMIWGLGFAVIMLGAFVGTVGWVGAMLLIFSASGRWVPAPPMAAIDWNSEGRLANGAADPPSVESWRSSR